MKQMTYGDTTSLIILVGAKMGIRSKHEEIAKRFLSGDAIHPSFLPILESESIGIHNAITKNPTKMSEANRIGDALKVEYGFLRAVCDQSIASTPSSKSH